MALLKVSFPHLHHFSWLSLGLAQSLVSARVRITLLGYILKHIKTGLFTSKDKPRAPLQWKGEGFQNSPKGGADPPETPHAVIAPTEFGKTYRTITSPLGLPNGGASSGPQVKMEATSPNTEITSTTKQDYNRHLATKTTSTGASFPSLSSLYTVELVNPPITG